MALPRRVLVTRIRQIGDAILTLPLVDALHALAPSATIDYLAEAGPAQAVLHHPAIRRVHSFHPRSWPGLPAGPALLGRLVAARYDWVIDLYGNPRSAQLTLLTGAPVRVGPARRSRRWFYTHTLPAVKEPLSAVDHHRLALEALGYRPGARTMPRIHLTEKERAEGVARVDAAVPSGTLRVGLHVGNRWPAKRWPEEKFRSLLRSLSRLGAEGVVLAGPGEDALARRIAEGARGAGRNAPVLSGLKLRQYFGAVAAMDALVTNDGSPLHIGPALEVPTVGILGPTVPEIWFPYSRDQGHQLLCRDIWCRPCHRHECARMDCLHWITVEEAIRALERALAFGKRARATA
jgi:heptosyltransferase-2